MTFVSRFAPSTTGPAHPGTLLAGLLAWLDARQNAGTFILRLEDLDPQRSTPHLVQQMQEELRWFGLDWDSIQIQSEHTSHYEKAMDTLESMGRLYPCSCSRKQIKSAGHRAPDGGWRYPNTCRGTPLPNGGWRQTQAAIRIELQDIAIHIHDQNGEYIEQNPGLEMGDPIALRRDGAFGYNLCTVVDDHLGGITHIVRGRDLSTSSPTHWEVQQLLDSPHPTYRHHFLFMEEHRAKLAKLHGAVGVPELRRHYRPEQLVGLIAHYAGLLKHPIECSPYSLIESFDWASVTHENQLLHWNGTQLVMPSA